MAPLGALSQAWTSVEASLPHGWQQDECIATFHLDAKDAARLTALGADVVRAWAASQEQPSRRKMDRSVSGP